MENRQQNSGSVQADTDLFIIGAGSGGLAAAKAAAALGAKVVLAEAGRVGGTCVLRGCIPKKFLTYARDLADSARMGLAYGFEGPLPRLDWGKLMQTLTDLLARLEQVHRTALDKAGVQLLEARARVVAPQVVEANGKRWRARKILLATGGAPRSLPVEGGARALSSDGFFNMAHQPKSVAIVGGGYIGVELAAIMAALGTETHLLVRGQLLREFDSGLSAAVAAALRQIGVHLHLKQPISALVAAGTETAVQVPGQAAPLCQVAQVIAAVGRSPNTAGLIAPELGLKLGPDGAVPVDARHATALPDLYAIGDVTDRLNLTPVAIRAGRTLAAHLFAAGDGEMDYGAVPRAIFGMPPAASVGLSQAEAEAEHGAQALHCYTTEFTPLKFSVLPAAARRRTWMKAVVARADGRVLGLHMVGEDAPEILQGFAVALKAGLTKTQLDAGMPLHPTSAEEFVLLR